MAMDEEIRELTLNSSSADQIKRAAVKNGMRNLRYDGIRRAMKGITSVEEVLRVTNAS
jgi:type II secretory ATPase GspE/PulE/Tfp pilus assembly ATPase PilB-like protein